MSEKCNHDSSNAKKLSWPILGLQTKAFVANMWNVTFSHNSSHQKRYWKEANGFILVFVYQTLSDFQEVL